MGPVTEEEYLSREKHYDNEIQKYTGIDPSEKKLKERMEILRKYKYGLFEDLQQKVYAARGWDSSGVPTVETLKRLKIDFPEAVELVNSVK